jgi:hypothetical protein
MPSTLALAKPKKKGQNCLAPPQNVTVAYLAYKVREEAVFKNAFDAINAGDFSFPCPIDLLLVPELNQANAHARYPRSRTVPKSITCTCCVGRLSEDPNILLNTTVLYYGRVQTTGVSAVESGYRDYIERKVTAGFVTSTDGENYAKIGIDREMVVFNVFEYPFAGSQTRIPGLFTMLGGPAFGPNALAKIIKHYGWGTVALYFQNAKEDVIMSETFVSIALLEGIMFDLQKRESAGVAAIEVDFADLVSAKSNVFIFFGGPLICGLQAARLTS